MGYADGLSGPLKTQTVTIASAATDSSAFDTELHTFMAILCPAALTGTSFTFKASDAIDGTFTAVLDDSGNPVSITVGTSRWVGIAPTVMAKLAALRFLKFVSSGAEGGARSFTVVSR